MKEKDKKMKIVKMFDFNDDIRDTLDEYELTDEFFDERVMANDVAISWYVKDSKDWHFESDMVINDLLRKAGCEPGEKVFIWISW